MRAFYCDQFVLPLPEGHRFPMAKYSRLREKVVEDGVLPLAALHEPSPASWDDLGLVHTPEASASIHVNTIRAAAACAR